MLELPRSKTRVGCMTMLLLFALLGVYGEYLAPSVPSNDGDGSGRMGLFGLIAVGIYIVAVVIDEFRAWLAPKPPEPRGFEPIIDRCSSNDDAPAGD